MFKLTEIIKLVSVSALLHLVRSVETLMSFKVKVYLQFRKYPPTNCYTCHQPRCFHLLLSASSSKSFNAKVEMNVWESGQSIISSSQAFSNTKLYFVQMDYQ